MARKASTGRHALPEHPELAALRRQARALLKAWRAGDAVALARAAPHRVGPEPRLADALRVVAREQGHPSWPQLRQAWQRRQAALLDGAGYTRELVRLALGQGFDAPQPQRAAELVAARAQLLRADRVAAAAPAPPGAQAQREQALVQALLLGNWPAARPLLLAEPALIRKPLPPLQAQPLVYAAASSLARLERFREGLVQTVEGLLALGADPNAGWIDPDLAPAPAADAAHAAEAAAHALPVLYGAVSRAACAALVQRLLAAGARPDDGESLYHAVEQSDRSILAALIQAGARWTGTNALGRQLDFEDLPALQQCLAAGADPNEPDGQGRSPLQHALLRGRSLATVQSLVAAGARLDAVDAQGRSVAEDAWRSGNTEVCRWLAAQGALLPLQGEAAFLAACAAGDEAAARAHLARHPQAVAQLSEAGLRLLPDQAQRGDLPSVRLMLALGWPVHTPGGDWQASALNQAAFRGDAAMVQLLITHGARWDERNGYGGTALGSCLHAACNQPEPGGDYAAVLAALLAQGAPRPEPDELPPALRPVLQPAQPACTLGPGPAPA